MTPLVRFLLGHALIGFGVAVPFVGLLLLLDVGHLRTLVTEPDFHPGAVLLLLFFVGLTFGSLQMGYAVWQAGKEGPRITDRPRADDEDKPERP